MIEKLGEVNAYLRPHFDLEFNLGIGLHFGSVIVGEVGHPSKRQMTVMGDTVNVASRIEAANKRLKTQLLVSADLLSHVRDSVEPGKACRLKLKGKPGLQTVTEICGLKG
jgi:adenylate cyclase